MHRHVLPFLQVLKRLSPGALAAVRASHRRAPTVGWTGLSVAAVATTWSLFENGPAYSEAPSSGPYLTANFIADAAARASASLVNIRVGSFHQSSGSGFVIDANGTILTNSHVVSDALRFGGGGAVSVTLSDGVTVHGVVQHADPVSDIAIVKVNAGRQLPAVALGSSAALRPGEFVVALGAPAGLTNSVSAGIVSSVERTRSDLGLREPRGARSPGMHYIQTDAAINQGNSGGPLLNLQGEVIGVNTMKVQGMDGIAFAVPIDEAKRVVNQLMRHGRVLRPYLGLKFIELDEQVSRTLERHPGSGVNTVPKAGLYVMHVNPDSPAQRAGVRGVIPSKVWGQISLEAPRSSLMAWSTRSVIV